MYVPTEGWTSGVINLKFVVSRSILFYDFLCQVVKGAANLLVPFVPCTGTDFGRKLSHRFAYVVDYFGGTVDDQPFVAVADKMVHVRLMVNFTAPLPCVVH